METQPTTVRTSFFREIHKNTWLKRLSSRCKKSEKHWVVFCVHDDSTALLEAYSEPRLVVSHNPEWVIPLKSAQHVSHSLVANEEEYEFVITLANEVVKFHANTWILMQEWVETLQTKLREMKILSPKENVYTKLPEHRQPLLSTRDPTSPLPATPLVPAAIVPGIECVVPIPKSNPSTSKPNVTAPIPSTSTDEISDNLSSPSTSNLSLPNDEHLHMVNAIVHNGNNESLNDENHITSVRNVNENLSSGVYRSQIECKDYSIAQASNCVPVLLAENPSESNQNVGLRNENNVTELNIESDNMKNAKNITVIKVSDSTKTSENEDHLSDSESSSRNRVEVANNYIASNFSPSTSMEVKQVIVLPNSSGITNVSVNDEEVSPDETKNHTTYEAVSATSSASLSFNKNETLLNPLPLASKNIPSTSKSLFRLDAVDPVNKTTLAIPDLIHRSHNNQKIQLTNTTRTEKTNLEKSIASVTRNNDDLLNRRPSRKDKTKILDLSLVPSTSSNDNNDQRKRSSSTSETQGQLSSNLGNSNLDLRSKSLNFNKELALENRRPNLTLREQQVFALRREITHPGGIRLQLRRKDCVGSIALIDAFGAVWVVGWKQKEHPMLYNALHIGDQLVAIAGAYINSSSEANKLLKSSTSLFVEILVRRIPFGRVFAIKREREGQCLGLIRDGNTATIVDVVPNSLAARHGLTPKVQSFERGVLTFWVLTEINGRPLNLFFKENEIQDRLNSVGRDISILVQPFDLVQQFKKHLKSLRSYKDFIVQ